jgi:two-component system, chemotaxis family, CheB/CheR fusion protein
MSEPSDLLSRLARAEQALRDAEEASRSKDHFLATLSHELRTPLTPVLAVVANLAEDSRLPQDARAALVLARRNIELEARLIDDLLDLTRVSRGKLEIHREAADLRPVLEHAVLISCGHEVATGRIRLEMDLRAESHCVWADTSRLSQVFWNLLKNAVKFTPGGGTISVRSWSESGGLTVAVADTGIGIEPEVLPRIFDAFEQTDRRITRRYGGLGLGLAISRAILELHGGTLTVSSSGRGRGAVFTVHLPTALPGLPEGAEACQMVLEEQVPPLRILLVEDHVDTADAMADLLQARGHQVTVAMDMKTALSAAEAVGEGGFDLLVSDLGLPDGSGLDLMRELGKRYHLRGIALSGYGMDEDIRRSLDAGFLRHLTKPVSPKTLEAAIRQAVAG